MQFKEKPGETPQPEKETPPHKKSSALKRGIMAAALPVLSLLTYSNTAQATEKPKSPITQKFQEDREKQLSTVKNQIEELNESSNEYREYIKTIRPSQAVEKDQIFKEYFEKNKQQYSYQESPREISGKDIREIEQVITEAKQKTSEIKEKQQQKETLEFKYILQFTQNPDLPNSKDVARHIVSELHKIQNDLLDNYPLYKYRNLEITEKLDGYLEYMLELKEDGQGDSDLFKTMHKNLSEVMVSLRGQNVEMGTVDSLLKQKLSMPEKIDSQITKIFEKTNKNLDDLNVEKFKSVCNRFLTKLGNDPIGSVEYQKIIMLMENNIQQYQNILNKIANNYTDKEIKNLEKTQPKKKKHQFFNLGTTSNPKDGGYDSNQKEGQTLTVTYGRDDVDIIPFPKAKD
ncbi:MAG TPA: hypothetical protein PLB38_00560 [bacterium]|nr:hypothetical protein [bacterium]